MFNLYNKMCEAKKMGFTDCVCVGPGREMVYVCGRGGGRLACFAEGDWSEVVCGGHMWFGVVYMWFGDNMAGRGNKNAFKFVLQVLILSQKQLLGI